MVTLETYPTAPMNINHGDKLSATAELFGQESSVLVGLPSSATAEPAFVTGTPSLEIYALNGVLCSLVECDDSFVATDNVTWRLTYALPRSPLPCPPPLLTHSATTLSRSR